MVSYEHMTAYQEILNWVATLPVWQQDAVRRIMEVETLKPEDLAQLASLAKAEAGIPLPKGTKPGQPLIPLGAVQTAGQNDSILLLGIDDLQNINALADAQPIPFAPTGLTVIFGDNGSGKTGFGRLLRTLCSSRKRPARILRNIDKPNDLPQQAVVSYRSGATDRPKVTWTEGQAPPSELSRISVFDSDCASVYLNDEQQTAYAPFGLDLFPKLSDVCDAVRVVIQAELDALTATTAEWPEDLKGTAVAEELAKLPQASALNALRTIPLSPTERQTFEILTKSRETLRRENPQAKIVALRSQALRLGTVVSRAKKVVDGLSAEKIQQLQASAGETARKVLAARAASDLAFGGALLPGTGGAVWEELWKAARKFSTTSAYHDHAYPAADDGDKCVLCQQELGGDARARLKSFEKFVNDEASTQSAIATERVAQDRAGVMGVECIWSDIESVTADLESVEAGLGYKLSTFLDSNSKRKTSILEAKTDADWAAVPASADSPMLRLVELAVNCAAQAKQIEDAGEDEERQAQEREWKALNAREWVTANQAKIVAEAERLALQAKLEKATKRGTDTKKITNTGSRLTEKYITSALQERFVEELTGLRVGHLGVKLEVKRGAKGKTTHHLILTRGFGLKVVDILSTGELNSVALAAFFAELDPGRKDAIVFDDPVSSLDQDKREQVALRLCQEAQKRQVIVWTHDLSFLGSLQDWRDGLKTPTLKVLTIHNLSGEAGIVEEAMPWPVMKLSDRIKKLRADLNQLRNAAKAKDAETYGMRSRNFYGHLRDSWERAVEEVLFKKVIERYRKSIQTKLLREVADNVQKSDFETIHEAMSHASTYAHDASKAAPPPPPRIEQAEQDLLKLETWLKGRPN